MEASEDPSGAAKAVFVAAFNDVIEDIKVEDVTVAEANMDEDGDITVTFKTSDSGDILAGAGVVFEALQDLAEAGSSITINEQEFNLEEDLDISALAQAILGEGGIDGFLETGTLEADYTATVVVEGEVSFELSGKLTFTLDAQ